MASRIEVCCPHCGVTCSPDSHIHPVCSNCGQSLTAQGQPLNVDDKLWNEVRKFVLENKRSGAIVALRCGAKAHLSLKESTEAVDALMRILPPRQIPAQSPPPQQTRAVPLAAATKHAQKPKGFIQGFLHAVSSTSPTVADSLQPTLQQEVQNSLATLNGYNFSQVHIAQNGISGIAADTDHNVICILGRDSVLGAVKTNLLFPPQDILQVEIVEDGYAKTDAVSQAVTKSEMRTSNADMVKRAVIGGIAAGPVGAVIGGATAKKKGQEVRRETTQGTTRDMVNRVDLRILVNDPVKPLYNVNFLDVEAYRGSPPYQEAIDRATHWQAVINVLRMRS